ncbi:hypothetical protein N7468_009249 [Penicillium chermesinum]|uniref:Uncharacterized protein n=1 Tax=Penicillium chermesinum TaxID=63820 RepID=A0A9W9NHG0_9EURO|nr:uncharacterized protein N7468_009249 [Penicillium chermesinum]KAJ5220045.1 hypothetical protein N7468_009249 [Penicillium chermesinum]KAJ6157498.1 hypothetical protein N7470_005090 [Penicillium chermesinum]
MVAALHQLLSPHNVLDPDGSGQGLGRLTRAFLRLIPVSRVEAQCTYPNVRTVADKRVVTEEPGNCAPPDPIAVVSNN